MKYSVTDVAKILGLTPSALHFYEKEKLLEVDKDEHNHRLYQVGDIFRLLSYTKYRSMGFSMKTVLKQFSGVENDRRLIIQRMEKQREEASKKAAYYHELADSIDGHITSVKRIESLLDEYEFTQSPHTLFLYDEECGWMSKDRRAQGIVQKWVKAMPAARLAVMLHSAESMNAGFGYAITPRKAQAFALSMDLNMQELLPVSCLHTIIATDDRFPDNPHIVFEKALDYARSRGFTLVGNPWGYILLVEVAPQVRLKPYVELWVPIR
ncbi:MerR family transcriptional regulator [Spirochaetia bacterium]|nr:MerR family transcriptional regulator [Spirochaetia bacterium]